MVDRVASLNSKLPEEWAQRNGLKYREHHVPRGLVSLIDGRRKELAETLATLDKERQIDRRILDHPRVFSRPSGSSIVALTSAPYERALLDYFNGDGGAAVARIYEIAESLELRVRIGHFSDVTYLSAHDGDPTVPIVWWQPKRVLLPYPPLRDPNPEYSGRMAH